MKNNNLRPNWFLLVLLVGGVLRLFWLEVKAPFSQAGHIWAEIGLALLLYGIVAVWLKANEKALLMGDMEKVGRKHEPVLSQAGCLSNSIPGAAPGRNDHGKLMKPSLVRYAGRIAPAWLATLVSSLGEFFHRPF
jgi:hypothetical protein